MNYTAVRQLYRSRPAFRELFEWISGHEIDTSRMTVEELLADGRLARRQTIGALRELEQHGCGQFKVGRKGHASRFEWSIDPQDLAARLLDGDARVEPVIGEALGERVEPSTIVEFARPRAEASTPDEMFKHVHRLRPELAIEVLLPKDLTRREAEVLGDWLRDLSFER
jgi:hypothetical protein